MPKIRTIEVPVEIVPGDALGERLTTIESRLTGVARQLAELQEHVEVSDEHLTGRLQGHDHRLAALDDADPYVRIGNSGAPRSAWYRMVGGEQALAEYDAQQPKPKPKPGSHKALLDGLNADQAVNLLEALKLVPNTGHWYGALRIACENRIYIDREAHRDLHMGGGPALGDAVPHQTAEQQADIVVTRAGDLLREKVRADWIAYHGG